MSDWLVIRNARGHNLKGVDVAILMGVVYSASTGVSGSGKSTLVQETLFPRLCSTNCTAPVGHGSRMMPSKVTKRLTR
ncbi:MAG: hypothetical protein R2688_04180 [Fimbriimonadaceae bacterium]